MFSNFRLKSQSSIRTGLALPSKKIGGQNKKSGIHFSISKFFLCISLAIVCYEFYYIIKIDNNDISYKPVSTPIQEIQENAKSDVQNSKIKQTKDLIAKIKNEFFERYGGKEDALKLLSKGIIAPGANVKNQRGNEIEVCFE